MGYYIKPNCGSERPKRILCFDTEADIEHLDNGGQRHTLRLGHAILMTRTSTGTYARKHYPFKTIEDWYKIIDSCTYAKTKLYIAAHNTAYDYSITDMDQFFSSRDYIMTRFVIGQVFSVHAERKKDQSSIHVIDSMNWFKTSLAKMGKSFGLPKMEVPDFDHVDDLHLAEYCKNDVMVLAHVLEQYFRFLDQHNLGNFAETSAGQAMNAFRHRFMPERSICIHHNDKLYPLEQETYRGGRCEAFRIGSVKDVYKVDVNSMYPFVMQQYIYPTKPISNEPLQVSDSCLGDLLYSDDIFIIGDFDISINEPCLGIKRDKLIFPTGRIAHAKLTTPELKIIYENGGIIKTNHIQTYEAQELFNNYIDYFYTLRMEFSRDQNLAGKDMAKLFMNSLYGKFGQRKMGEISLADNTLEWELALDAIGQNMMWDIDTGNRIIRLGNKIYSITPPLETPGNRSCPVISSAVTSYARCYLWHLFERIGLEHIFYCDTDSIFTDEYGYNILHNDGFINETLLGAMKLEGVGNVKIMGAKNYTWQDKDSDKVNRCIKGVPKTAKYDEEKDIYDYLEWRTKIKRYESMDSGLVALNPTQKTLSTKYDKGIVLANGMVKPIELMEC